MLIYHVFVNEVNEVNEVVLSKYKKDFDDYCFQILTKLT